MDPGSALQQFLQPLQVDVQKVHILSRLFYSNFKDLALNAHDQFLPTPISESILRPVSQHGRGRYVPCLGRRRLSRLVIPIVKTNGWNTREEQRKMSA